jgi:glyoxylate reductase
MPFQILVTGRTFEQHFLKVLRERGFVVEFHSEHLTEAELKQALKNKDAFILGGVEFVSAKALESNDTLKVIAVAAVGYQSYVDLQAATRKGILVTNTPNANARATAEMTISLMTSLWRQVAYLNSEVKKGQWPDDVVAGALQGAVLGIVGAGTIGSIVAEIAAFGFGMEILYHSRSAKPELEKRTRARRMSLEELLRESDVVSLHVPLTDETKYMIDSAEFSLMKPTTILVNTARPRVVAPQALQKALSTKSIAGCAMDGYYDEPPSEEIDRYRLLNLPDDVFLITPHVGYLTHQSIYKMSALATDSVINILEGRPWKYVVNPA